MHGRVRVKTTAEQQEAKNKERAKKLELYRAGFEKARQKRENRELDDEGLAITGQMLTANPDIYTLWNFRREIILHMQTEKSEADFTSLMEDELLFVEHCLLANPKSYNCWHQRQWTLEQMTNPNWSKELHLCNKYLELDDRNFHVWDYRRFVVENSKVDIIEELKYTDTKIASNFSNYSSWHYRSKLLPVIYPDPNGHGHLKEEKLLEEIDLVQNAAFTDPNDQSAWFYNRWLLGKGEQPLDIIFVYLDVCEFKCGIVLNKPLKIGLEDLFRIEIDTEPIPCKWSVPPFYRKIGLSNIWIGRFIEKDFGDNQHFCVYYIQNENVVGQTLIRSDEGPMYTWKKESKNEVIRFRDDPSAATKSVLEQELESCKQLHELEPENKWALFTSILLMRELDFSHYYADVLLAFEKLKAVDPLRKGHYRDLRSKFVIEKKLQEYICGCETSWENFSNLELTALYHKEYMIHISTINLSHNYLVSLKFANVLHFVCHLDVSGNEIEDCDGLQEMPHLSNLNLSNNQICELDALASLGSCTFLKVVSLSGNPVVKHDNLRTYMKTLVPILDELNI